MEDPLGLMDIVGGLVGQMGAKGGEGQEGQSSALLSAAMNLIQNHPGGIEGLLGQLQQAGLGDQVASWVGNGENQPISGEHVQAALGEDQVQQLAAQTGLSQEQTSSGLAALLPQVIDKLSPNGQLAEGGGLTGLLKGFLG